MAHRKTVNAMWLDAVNMLDRADQLHRQFFQLGSSPSRGPSWEPPADMFEAGDTLSVIVALPGIGPENLQITIENDLLHVQAHRPIPAPRGAHLKRLEIPYGHFERYLRLPAGHFQIQASSLNQGCLTLTLKKLR